ncbi:DUF4258 domain-containing protein [Paludibaculum fermentans]|uniref:DUF4258 domain-containing protein n=1 Tax=Paludibaculum fermentans TaxID=1473598 RepID=UPI003EBCC7D2
MHDEPLSGAGAKAKLIWCLEAGAVIYSRHFRDELQSDNLTMEDVIRVCKSGMISMAPEQDIRTGQWKYRIEGFTAELSGIAVVFTLRTELAVYITVFKRAT